MPRLDLTSLRYIASIAAILIGVGLLVIALTTGGDEDPATALVITPTPGSESPAPVSPTATIPLPSPVPLVKGTQDDCFRTWRFVDNPVQRWTICLPANFLIYDGNQVQPFEDATPDQLGRAHRDFQAVNEPWFLRASTEIEASSDVFGPVLIRIEMAAPGQRFDGCDPRTAPVGPGGIVGCTDRLSFQTGAIVPEGQIIRYRALLPTVPGRSASDVFSINLTISSYAINLDEQQEMFGFIQESLKPY